MAAGGPLGVQATIAAGVSNLAALSQASSGRWATTKMRRNGRVTAPCRGGYARASRSLQSASNCPHPSPCPTRDTDGMQSLPDPTSQAKRELRTRLRAARRERAAATSPADRDAQAAALSRLVREVLAALPAHPTGTTGTTGATDAGPDHRGARRCVAVFEALPTEVPTHQLLADLVAEGHEVLVPVLLADKDLDWRRWLAPGAYGLPVGTAGIARADLVLVPAMAVDDAGRRLGQGGGSYDRALPRRHAGTPIIALVDDAEVVDGPLPVDDHDTGVDAYVTPTGHHRIAGGR